MKKTSKPIVFFGSGPVAAESLRLLAQDFTIEAVITKPTTIQEMTAASHGAQIYAVSNKYELDDLITSIQTQSVVGVLVDFGIIVSRKVIDAFPLGIVNSHFSILPEWRGADPISFAILSGQKTTGVSLMLLVEAMDEGPLLAYSEYELNDEITTPELTNDLIQLSHTLLAEVLPKYMTAEVEAMPQSVTGRKVSYSRKLTKEDGILNWSKPAVQLEREVRAFIGWPKSRAKLGDVEVIITKAHAIPTNHQEQPGKITASKDGVLMVACGEGYLCLDELKPAGKKEMAGKAFLAGYKARLGL